MRKLVLLVTLLLASGGFAGCIGDKTDAGNVDPAKVPTTGGSDPGVLRILAELSTSLTVEAAEWVAPGTTIAVEVAAPINAAGDVTYAWAIGQLPGAAVDEPVAHDTGIIQPGASGSLRFDVSGHWLMHCHPHPWMEHGVTVIDGYDSPDVVHVQIIDGDNEDEYLYVPENIVIGVGTEVVYHNNGTQPHTTTTSSQEPSLTLLPLTSAHGEVTLDVDRSGWYRIVAVMADEEGRIGQVEHHIYINAIPENFSQTFSGEFLGALPISEAFSENFPLELGGKMFVNLTVSDSSGADLNQVKIHIREQGMTQDTFTGGPTGSRDFASVTVNRGVHTVEIVPERGADLQWSLDITVLYTLTPPAKPTVGGDDGNDDGHGGHQH